MTFVLCSTISHRGNSYKCCSCWQSTRVSSQHLSPFKNCFGMDQITRHSGRRPPFVAKSHSSSSLETKALYLSPRSPIMCHRIFPFILVIYTACPLYKYRPVHGSKFNVMYCSWFVLIFIILWPNDKANLRM